MQLLSIHQSGSELDIYIPDINLAIEYQGEQHYVAFEHMGGEDGLQRRIELDSRKADLCKKNGVNLYCWHYEKNISRHSVEELISQFAKK